MSFGLLCYEKGNKISSLPLHRFGTHTLTKPHWSKLALSWHATCCCPGDSVIRPGPVCFIVIPAHRAGIQFRFIYIDKVKCCSHSIHQLLVRTSNCLWSRQSIQYCPSAFILVRVIGKMHLKLQNKLLYECVLDWVNAACKDIFLQHITSLHHPISLIKLNSIHLISF